MGARGCTKFLAKKEVAFFDKIINFFATKKVCNKIMRYNTQKK